MHPFDLFKRILPKTLFGRALMILVTPLILLQLVATHIFIDRHWETITRRLTGAIAGEIAVIINESLHDQAPETRARLFREAQHKLQLRMAFTKGAVLPDEKQEYSGILDRFLARDLKQRIQRPFVIDTTVFKEKVIIDVQLPDGVLTIIAPGERLFSSTTYILLFWMVGTSLILIAVAVVFLRNQIRPIRRLAAAADRFGKGRGLDQEFHISGAREVRQAGSAFNLMRARISRQIRQRTDMLSGVSHDLRTPLTRMKLQLAMLGDDEAISELNADVVEMETMIEGYLTFARGEGDEPAVESDLSELVESAVAGWRRNGSEIDCHVEGMLKLPVQKDGLRRCIDNLISNANRYGNHIWVRAGIRDEAIELTVDDDGPGIPEDNRQDVFRPFHRLDESRNPETGGTGLGLAIARDIARSHGGDISLEDSPHGGLRARVRLPI
ncbi:MAG: ATP-binding protein [Alphaproteobacteria bacterium]|nr:ATP-binding protein [Alphaproteobacteria bacterium]